MRVLITGGAGFVGVNLARRLLTSGYELRCLDNYSTGSHADAVAAGFTDIVEGDVTDRLDVDAAAEGCGAIVHLAAQSGVQPSIADPWNDATQNIFGTLAVLLAAKNHDVGHVVAASSAAPLGGEGYPANEKCMVNPLSPYGASKTSLEAYCSAFAGSYGINASALRFSNLYGPYSYHKGSVVAHFMKSAFGGEPLQINGDGTQTRDFCFVDDVCSAIQLVLEAESPGPLYQLGSGSETSILELIELLNSTFGVDLPTVFAPPLAGEIPRSRADIGLATKELGYTPQWDLATGLDAAHNWFASQLDPNSDRTAATPTSTGESS